MTDAACGESITGPVRPWDRSLIIDDGKSFQDHCSQKYKPYAHVISIFTIVFAIITFVTLGSSMYTKSMNGEDVNRRLSCNPLTIEVFTDDYGNETSWHISQLSGGETFFESNEETYTSNAQYEQQICVSDGSFLFEVEDGYGNGMCCSEGDGYFAVLDDGKEILRGGRFTDKSMHVIRVGYDPLSEMDENDKAWLKAHNDRRRVFHEDNEETFVPLQFSADLKNDAQRHLSHLMEECDGSMHAEQGIAEGANLFAEMGFNASNQLDQPEEVLYHWVDQKKNKPWPKNAALTQVYWRGSRYMGCAQEKTELCEIHICRYEPPGNCDMARYNSTVGDNWKIPVLMDYSYCGHLCPDDGCYYFDFEGAL